MWLLNMSTYRKASCMRLRDNSSRNDTSTRRDVEKCARSTRSLLERVWARVNTGFPRSARSVRSCRGVEEEEERVPILRVIICDVPGLWLRRKIEKSFCLRSRYLCGFKHETDQSLDGPTRSLKPSWRSRLANPTSSRITRNALRHVSRWNLSGASVGIKWRAT